MHTAGRLGLAGAMLLGLVASARAGERETALIDQAIKAHGGAAALTKAQTVVRTGSGTLFVGAEAAFTDEATFALPGRAKLILKSDAFGQVIIVLNGDRGWRSAGGMVNEVPKEGLDEIREEAYVDWLTTLVPLRKDGFDLAPAADKTVDGKPAAGVKVASKGHGDVRLYFDKASGLLVQIERQSKEAGIAATKEYVFGGHKDFDGVKLPTKRTELLNGKKFVELTATSYKFPSKLDDATFGKP